MQKISIKDKLFVTIQIILLIAYLIPIKLINFELNFYFKYFCLAVVFFTFIEMLIALFQLNKSLTEFPTPKENGILITNGVYKYIRHPIYTGIIISTLFFGIYNTNSWEILISMLLFILFYFKSNYEELMLEKHYTNYKEYKKKTYKFFPLIL